jgi:hypothetical protein
VIAARAARTTALLSALTCAAPALGCDDGSADAPNKAPRGAMGHHEAAETPAPAETARAQGSPATQAAQAAQAMEPAPVAAPQQNAVPAPAPEQEPERDLNAELQAAFGSPASCIKPRLDSEAAPSAIRVDLEAHLVQSGLVSRGYARSSQLDAEELACLEKRLGALRLRGPIEGAPRSARTHFDLELKPPEKSGP